MNFKLFIYRVLTKLLGRTLYLDTKSFLYKVKERLAVWIKASLRLVRDGLRAIGVLSPTIAPQDNYNETSVLGRSVYLSSTSSKRSSISHGLTIVTLNLNSEKFISDYLRGFTVLPEIPIQIVFVDHNSSDMSVELIRQFSFSSNIELTLIQKEFNDTFSRSNNEALGQAKHNFVLFLNNDVLLQNQSDLLSAINLLSENSHIGVVGWELYHDSALTRLQHSGISFLWDNERSFFRPINIATTGANNKIPTVSPRLFPAVTAAMSLCRKADLLEIGGFDETYNYGYEDVDLCLRMMTSLNKESVLLSGAKATHSENKSQKRDSRLDVRKRRLKNQAHFIEKFGLQLRLLGRRTHLDNSSFYNLKRTTIGFVVTEAFDGASAGDYFTALEFASALETEFECDTKFFAQRGKGAVSEVDCSKVEILIVMIDRFDISKLKNRTSNTVVIAWMRNWFDRWVSWPYFVAYDVYLSSSTVAQKFIESTQNVTSKYLGIATNSHRFMAPVEADRSTDIVFVGSRWNVPRDIENTFSLLEKFNTKIYGHGWDDLQDYYHLYQGAVDYRDVPRIYADAKIVIDDAASSTKEWQSTNSRVYDALAAGCLVITNADSSGDLCLPRYSNNEELAELLERYLGDEQLRFELCSILQKQVIENHTYTARAAQFRNTVANLLKTSYRIAIKVPAPNEQEKHKWGDYHFADSLMSSLKALGHFVRIDLLDSWDCKESLSDDVVIVLRGLSEYKPRKDQINIMWNISHPDKISDSEYDGYDLVFVASSLYAKSLQERLPQSNIKPLLQCTDARRFFFEPQADTEEHEVLFVGNSRRIYRDVVKHSINCNLPISVYGGLWQDLIPKEYIKGENVPNTELRKFYRDANIVLNDHWESMRTSGFISNRLFDVVASGGIAVSDHIEGMKEIFGNSVLTYDGSSEDFASAIAQARELKREPKDSEFILQHHTFDARAKEILSEIDNLIAERLHGWIQ